MSDGAPDQSMEDILASIKRVINADVTPPRRTVAQVEPEPEDDDVLELGDAIDADVATPRAQAEGEALLSGASMEASKAALAQLAALTIDPRAGDNTLDGLVRELLRPMLKTWLDANLPELVERIVAREVARVVGR